MSVFNTESRTKNALKASFVGAASQILKVILGFGYRSLFLHFLTAEYLGINGLFSNVLQVLSLAELGITTAIVYRFYDPISRNDVEYVGRLMNFFKRVYLLIAGMILCVGLLVMPFIQYLINDINEVPADVNIYVIYGLFLGNTISSYLFTYKLSLLTADQRNYMVSIMDLIVTLSKYVLQIIILIMTRNYTLTLAIGIVSALVINYLFSVWVTRKYREVFKIREMLPKEERRKIYSDTRACMCHKVGSTILTSTDNAVLSRMVSLAAVGLYSNYTMIVSNIQLVMVQILGNLTASVGNARNTMAEENYYKLYRKMLFLDLWISGVVFVTCYVTIDDFILVWLGEKYVFDKAVSLVLCIQLYLSLVRTVNGAFIGADGLFRKDIVRPLIEAVLNLGISILLTHLYGMIGVFLGTIISLLLTTFWREPYLLYRYSFKQGMKDYWRELIIFTLISVLQICALILVKRLLVNGPVSLLFVIMEAIMAFLFANLINMAVFGKREEFQYLKDIMNRILGKLKGRSH